MQLLTLLREIVIEPEDIDKGFLRRFKDSIAEYIQEILTTEISAGHSSLTSTAKFKGVTDIDIVNGNNHYTYFDDDIPTAEWIAKFVVDGLDQRGITTKRAFLYQVGLISLDEENIDSIFPTDRSILESIDYREDSSTYRTPATGIIRRSLWFCSSGGIDAGRALVVYFRYN